jgi:hypothetical protein
VDIVDIAILALRLALAAVLYLFLWLVVRAVWRTMAVQRGRSVAQQRLRLLVLESGDSDLPAGEVIEVPDGATLGRAKQASLVLADPAVSGEHARFGLLEGAWIVSDLGSTNGTLLNQAQVHGAAALATGDVVALGTVRLQVVGH